jgi:GH43 family beta-xylosidase
MNKIIQTNITAIGDPVIFYENGVYYMFATYNQHLDFHVFTSTDGINFEDGGIALAHEDSFGKDRFWAPEIFKYNNEYYLFYSAGGEDGFMHIQVAKSKSIKGPFKDVKKKPLIYIEGKSTIDAHLFIDDDGKKYVFFSMDCSTNVVNGVHTSQLYACTINDTLDEITSDFTFISTPTKDWEKHSGPEWQWNEGPNILKHNGKYYLTYSTNFYASKEYCVGCLVSNNILGPYKHMIDKPVLSYIEEDKISGPGHNAFFIDKDGSLKVSFHIHTHWDKPSDDRRACYCSAHFENDILIFDYK